MGVFCVAGVPVVYITLVRSFFADTCALNDGNVLSCPESSLPTFHWGNRFLDDDAQGCPNKIIQRSSGRPKGFSKGLALLGALIPCPSIAKIVFCMYLYKLGSGMNS